MEGSKSYHVMSMTSLRTAATSTRVCYTKLDASMSSLVFEWFPHQHDLHKGENASSYLYLGLYANGRVINRMCINEIKQFNAHMHELFSMSNLGCLRY